ASAQPLRVRGRERPRCAPPLALSPRRRLACRLACRLALRGSPLAVVGRADDELAVADRPGTAGLELGEVEADPHVLEDALAEVGARHRRARHLEAPARLVDEDQPVALGL